MRIIAGTLKGRRLKTPRWEGLRPTSDKLRETLFNVLAPRVSGARVLDGYAGTGAIGIEAISRGARSVVFIDAHPKATALIAENLTGCGVEEGYTILCNDIVAALRHLPTDMTFDIIVLDPPYGSPDAPDALAAAADHLAPGGVLVLERATRLEPQSPQGLERRRDLRSGDSTLTFMERDTAGHPPPVGGSRTPGIS